MTTWYILTLGEDRYVVVVGAGYQVNHLGTVSDTVRDLQLISTQTIAIIIANQILGYEDILVAQGNTLMMCGYFGRVIYMDGQF